MTRSTVFLTGLWYLGLGVLSTSCSKKSSPAPSAIEEEVDGTASETTGTLVLELSPGEQMVRKIESSLVQEAGLSSTQAQTVTQGALDALGEGSTALTVTVDPADLAAAAPVITEAVMTGLGRDDAALTDEQKIAAAQTTTETGVAFIAEKIDLIPESSLEALPGRIAGVSVSALAEVGLDESSLTTAVGGVMRGTVAGLGTAYTARVGSVPQLLKNIATEGVTGLKSAPIGALTWPTMMNNFVNSSLGAVRSLGIPEDQMSAAISPFVSGAVGALSTAAIMQPSELKTALGPIMQGAVSALGTIGMSNTTYLQSTVTGLMTGAMDALSHTGLAATQTVTMFEDIMTGSVAALHSAGVRTAAAMTTFTQGMTSNAISYLGTMGVTDPTAVSDAAKLVATGAVAALGSYRTAGYLSAADIQTASGTIAQATTTAAYSYATQIGVSDFSTVATSLASGFTQGLAKAGWSASEISGANTYINSGFTNSFTSLGMATSTMNTYTNAVSTTTSAFVGNLEVECSRSNGTWNSSTQICNYPMAHPGVLPGSTTAGPASTPSASQYSNCTAIGGYILYTATGWLCETSNAPVASGPTEAQCTSSGFTWTGTSCQTVAPTTSCYSQTQSSCATVQGCIWSGSSCTATTMISCYNQITQATCTSTPGCYWNSNMCVNGVALTCSSHTTQATCSGQSGCVWSGSSGCANAVTQSCASQMTSATCYGMAGCSWMGTYCANMSTTSCTSGTTEATCNTTPGCVWSGSSCINGTTILCSSNVTQATCSSQAGCVWSGSSCINSATINCSGLTSGTCSTTQGCTWLSSTSSCVSSAATTGSCSSATTSPTCSAIAGCSWFGSYCSASTGTSNGTCSTRTTSQTCWGTSGCFWDGPYNLCRDTTYCTASTLATCPQTSCTAASTCLAPSPPAPSCSSQTSPSLCWSTSGCFWDNTATPTCRATTYCTGQPVSTCPYPACTASAQLCLPPQPPP